jgi:hypothetical protein|tara:strand:- start:82 stop:222 length:141 start_codon:yes stop_codon:yes gene_type:complete
MIRIENCTGRGGSTRRLHQKEIVVEIKMLGDSDEEASCKKNIGGNV